ncbi:MAG: MarR family winged helix-turn-helix transcriptional regulator [Pseudobdellovibrio sp.]
MTYEQIKLSNQLCHPLYSATNALMRIYKPLLSRIGITYPQYLVMMALWEQDKCNINTLSEMTYFDSGTLTPLLKKLCDLNFITIKTDKEDKRQKIISLTTKGLNLKEKAKDIPKDLICMVDVSKHDLINLKSLLETLHSKIVQIESIQKKCLFDK